MFHFLFPEALPSPNTGEKEGKLKEQLFAGAGTKGSGNLKGMKTTALDTDFIFKHLCFVGGGRLVLETSHL